MITSQKEVSPGVYEWTGYTENMKTIKVTSRQSLVVSDKLKTKDKQHKTINV